jgi:hypothetical protein
MSRPPTARACRRAERRESASTAESAAVAPAPTVRTPKRDLHGWMAAVLVTPQRSMHDEGRP